MHFHGNYQEAIGQFTVTTEKRIENSSNYFFVFWGRYSDSKKINLHIGIFLLQKKRPKKLKFLDFLFLRKWKLIRNWSGKIKKIYKEFN